MKNDQVDSFVFRSIGFLSILVMTTLVTSCVSNPKVVELSPMQRESQERALAERWARDIEGVLRTREDAALEERIAAISARLGLLVRPRVTFFTTGSAPRLSPVFALPGYHWYFSTRALKFLRYDNELAAAIAAAHALSEKMQQAAPPLLAPHSHDGGTLSIPTYSDEEWRRVNARMVDVLYRAQFDPRGVPQFWKKAAPTWIGMPPDWAIFLQEEAHALISQRTPLVNPVVRTPEFGEIEKRLKQL
jgi:hypothetical protein